MSAFKVIELLAPRRPVVHPRRQGAVHPPPRFRLDGLRPVIGWFARDAER